MCWEGSWSPAYSSRGISQAIWKQRTSFASPVWPDRPEGNLGHISYTRLLADGIKALCDRDPAVAPHGIRRLLAGDHNHRADNLRVATLYGGIRSVAIVDTIQLVVYLVSAVSGILVISHIMGMPVHEIFGLIPADRLIFFSSGLENGIKGFFGTYNMFSGIIGGALLSFASHGTDHLIVQRVLSCRDLPSARKAMIWSGILVLVQFALFMTWGLFIYAALGGKPFDLPDTIMPYFIINKLPPGIRGFMLAGIFAAAMSTISSSINSISSSTAMDLLMISRRDIPEKRKVQLSRVISFVWTLVMMLIAVFLKDTKSPLVELGLSIASITYGGMLGIFLQGALFKKFSDRAALAGVVASIASVLAISAAFKVFWPWFVPVGFAVSFLTGTLLNMAARR